MSRFAGLFTFLCLVIPMLATAQEADSEIHPSPYLQKVAPSETAVALEVAARRFVAPDSTNCDIWLVGVIHVGTKQYYAELQNFLDSCDRVLFECVSDVDLPNDTQDSPVLRAKLRARNQTILAEETAFYAQKYKRFPSNYAAVEKHLIRSGRCIQARIFKQAQFDENNQKFPFIRTDSTLSFSDTVYTLATLPKVPNETNFQRELAKILELEFQLNRIRYDRPHFVHCDLSMPDLLRVAQEKQIDTASLLRVEKTLHASGFIMDIATGFFKMIPQAGLIMRYVMVEAIVASTGVMESEKDNSMMRLILTERNEAVLSRLQKETQGNIRNVAIFYGAAHMDGIESALMKRGYRPKESRWFKAFEADRAQSDLPEKTFKDIEKQVQDALKKQQKKK